MDAYTDYQEAPPPAGHNSGAIDLALLLDAEEIRAGLRATYAEKIARRDELVASADRFLAMTAAGIGDDTMQGRAGDAVRQIMDEVKALEVARTAYKKPVLDATRTIDGFFKSELTDPLAEAQKKVADKMIAYGERKRREAEAAAAAEAQRKADEARRLAEAAERHRDALSLDAAIQAEQDALDAQDRASVPAKAAARVVSDLGTTTGLRMTRTYRLDDMMALVKAVAAGRSPISVLTLNEPVVKAMARDRNQRDLPGLAFVAKSGLSIR